MLKLMKRLLQILAIIFMGTSLPAQAQSSEQINNFDSRIKVTKQNVVEFTETITYNFGAEQRHGIFRYVPIEYTDEKGQKYHLALDFIDVVDKDDQKIPVETDRSDGNYIMKIGDPDKTITGVNTYKIRYNLTPVVRQEGDRGFLALDITGNGWNVPIARVSATILFEEGAKLADVQCFTGLAGSINQTCLAQESSPSVYMAQSIVARQGMTIQGFVPAAYVTNYLIAGKPAPLTSEDIIGFIILGLIVSAAGLVILIFLMRWLRQRKRRKSHTVIAQYEAPDGLTPAEIGLLQDDVSSMREITAMLIDLAVRGYIKIEQTAPKKWYRKAKYRLYKLKEPIGLSVYESKLLTPLFDGRVNVDVDDLNKSTMAAAIISIHSGLKAGLKKKGFYGSFKTEPGMIEKLLDTGNISDAGAAEWAKVEGLKLYLGVVEKERLNFTDAPERTPERFNALLPFAVALGVEKQWARQFEGIDVAKAAGWYVGTYPHFSSSALASDLGSNFTSTFSSNATVSSSSSGGSSGGGFGGGGGGSW